MPTLRFRADLDLLVIRHVGLFDEDDSDRGTPSEAPPPPRPLTIPFALFWFLIAGIASVFAILLTTRLRESASHDIVNAVACQALAYVACVALMVRIHAPERTLGDAIGLRPTHPAFYALAAGFGVALQVPADWMEFLINRVWPVPPETIQDQLQMLQMQTPLQRVMVPFVVACVGPAVEELFYRGVLHSGLRKQHSDWVVLVVVSALFAGAHMTPQLLPVYFVVGAALTSLRALSGSMLPPLVAHMAFNGVAIVSLMVEGAAAQADASHLPLGISIGGIGAALALLMAFIWLARKSERAQRARQEDAA